MDAGKTEDFALRGCGLPVQISPRAPLEDTLAEERRRKVQFGPEGGENLQACSEQPSGKAEGINHQEHLNTTNMKVTPLEQRPEQFQFTVGLKGYGQPYQHPAWTTSQSTYGRYPPPPGLNPKKFPRNSNFTNMQRLGGMATDGNFTTSVESEYLYRPKQG